MLAWRDDWLRMTVTLARPMRIASCQPLHCILVCLSKQRRLLRGCHGRSRCRCRNNCYAFLLSISCCLIAPLRSGQATLVEVLYEQHLRAKLGIYSSIKPLRPYLRPHNHPQPGTNLFFSSLSYLTLPHSLRPLSMATIMDSYNRTFDEHPSLNHSLVDFDYSDREQSPVFGLPSQHSGFRSEESESEPEPTFAPAAWTQSLKRGSGLYQHQQHLRGSGGGSRSRESSHESSGSGQGDRASPASIPLPASTPASRRGTPYSSPEPEPEPALTQVQAQENAQPVSAVEDGQEVGVPHATEPGTSMYRVNSKLQSTSNA